MGYVASGTKASIYTISGELVIDSTMGGNNLRYASPIGMPCWEWNGRNTNSLFVSTGVYYYVVQTSNGGPVLLTGKLLVINNGK